MKNQVLKKELQKMLPYIEYATLHKRLNITETKLSRLLNGTDLWEFQPLLELAKVVGYDPLLLIRKYGLKTNVSIVQADEITEKFNIYVGKQK